METVSKGYARRHANLNYVSFTYHNDRTAGEFWITRIDYTGNDAQGLAPYNHVEFVYEARPDSVTGYYAGDEVNRNKRLANVKVYADGTLFQDYQLTYETGATNRSRIKTIKQCATNGDCFNGCLRLHLMRSTI